MRLRRGFSALSVGLCAAMVVGSSIRVFGQNCRTVQNGDAIRSRGYVGGDGKVHYKIGYSGVPNVHIEAMQEAINKWNLFSHETGIVLEDTGGQGDIQFYPSSGGTGVCAAYVPGASLIWYNASYMAFAVNEREVAARVYAHELGHALGLTHKGAGSIMEHFPNESICRQAALMLPMYPVSDDRSELHDCERAAHTAATYGPPPAYYWDFYYPECRDTWLREEYWRCPDGCFLDFYVDILIWTNCH